MDRKTNGEIGKRKKNHLGRFRYIHAYSGIFRYIQENGLQNKWGNGET